MEEKKENLNKSTKVLGVKIDLLSKKEVLSKIDSFLSDTTSCEYREQGRPNLICTTNSEFIVAAQNDPEFKLLINKSFLSVPDGIGVLCANHFLKNYANNGLLSKISGGIIFGLSLPLESVRRKVAPDLGERIDGVGLVYDLAELGEKEGYSIFLLGGWPTDFWGRPLQKPKYDLAQKAGKELKKIYPELNLVGSTSEFSYKKEDDEKTLRFIKKKMDEKGVDKIDILIVCYGHEKQEKWIARNASRIPACLSIGAGGSFDYISGDKLWAPKWIQEANLEWLYRLLTQPWRIKRVLRSFPLFPIKVFFHSFKK